MIRRRIATQAILADDLSGIIACWRRVQHSAGLYSGADGKLGTPCR